MRVPKTIKGYISLMKRIEMLSPSDFKGFDDLCDDDKFLLQELNAEISNKLHDLEIYDVVCKAKADKK